MTLFTGATGRVGSAAAKVLVSAGVPFRALVRDPDKVAVDAVSEFFAENATVSLEEQTSTTADLLGRSALDLETFTQQFAGALAPAS
jgi:uncharacterized protein YbjT (DUF2867 family)